MASALSSSPMSASSSPPPSDHPMDELLAAAKRVLQEQVPRWMKRRQEEPFAMSQFMSQSSPSSTASVTVAMTNIPVDLDLDMLHMMDREPDLYDFVMSHDLSAAQWLFQQTIASEMNRDNAGDSSENTQEATVRLRVANLPPLPEYDLSETWRLPPPSSQFSPLQSLVGVVGAKSAAVDYIRSTKLVCSTPNCRDYDGEDLVCIRLEMPGESCGGNLSEDVSKREVSSRTVATVFPQDCFRGAQAGAGGSRAQGIKILVRDEYASSLVLGECYEIVGQPVYTSVSRLEYCPLLECLSIKPCPSFPKRLSRFLGNEVQMTHNLYRLYVNSLQSPWSFVRLLAYVFGHDIAPRGTFLKFKLALLLSLAAASQSNPARLPVLAVGIGCGHVDRLFRYGLALGHRGLVHNAHTHSLCGAIRKDMLRHVDAGTLLLAKDGVCYVPELTVAKNNTTETIRSVLERKAVLVETPTSASTTRLEQQPLECTIWASVATPPAGNKRKAAAAATQPTPQPSMCELSDSMRHLIDVFGTVFFFDEAGGELEGLLLRHALDTAQGRTQSPVSDQGLKMFLSQVCERSVAMEPDAAVLIKRYFVTSRRQRQMNARAGPEVPQSALKTISLMAESHAKLSLHPTVRLTDALAAIHLFEENMVAQYGYSFLEVEFQPHVPCQEVAVALGEEADDRMVEFHHRLQNMLNSHLNVSIEE